MLGVKALFEARSFGCFDKKLLLTAKKPWYCGGFLSSIWLAELPVFAKFVRESLSSKRGKEEKRKFDTSLDYNFWTLGHLGCHRRRRLIKLSAILRMTGALFFWSRAGYLRN